MANAPKTPDWEGRILLALIALSLILAVWVFAIKHALI